MVTVDRSAGRLGPPAHKALMRGCVAAALAMAVLPSGALASPAAPPRVEAALKSAAKSDRDLRDFYRSQDYRPLWIRGTSIGPEAYQLMDMIAAARLDGLNPRDYDLDDVAEAVDRARSGSPKALAKAEMRLSHALAHYISDLYRPADTGMIYLDPELKPTPPTELAALKAAASARSLEEHLDSVQRVNPIYGELREALAEHAGSRGLSHITIPSGPLLKPGADDDRVQLLRLRLGLPQDGGFDQSVVRATKAFQEARGLPADGVVGPRTLAALNANPVDRERLLRLNLERARALPANLGGRYIVVDAAAARLYMYEDGRVRDTMKVIVGKPTTQTPMIAGLIRYAVTNPYWNVPPDLVRNNIAPAIAKQGVSYLKSARYEVLSDWSENARVVDPRRVDWAAVAAGRQDLRVRQLPGKGNSMGKVKFMFPNDLGIWLHDTPDKELFDKAERRFSSGCVRVEDAPRLARWLFGKPLNMRSEAPEQHVALPQPVPVYITYLTAAPTAQGIAFREDAYNRDRAQMARMDGRSYAGGGAP